MALICFASVDFPEPLCPSIAIKSPCLISMSTSSTARVMPSTLPSSSRRIYSNVNLSVFMIPIAFPLSVCKPFLLMAGYGVSPPPILLDCREKSKYRHSLPLKMCYTIRVERSHSYV